MKEIYGKYEIENRAEINKGKIFLIAKNVCTYFFRKNEKVVGEIWKSRDIRN